MTAATVAAIGECMIELSESGSGFSLAFGGDSLNTSVYLARLGVGVDYVTALGDDPYSDAMLAFWQAEGVGTAQVARLAGRLPGLYTIRTDTAGERSFYYWRSASAAREMLQGEAGHRLSQVLPRYEVLYLTGVSLSILDPASRGRLLAIIAAARANGARIVFDSNYRPRGWPDVETAYHAIELVYQQTDLALPSPDDERALFGDADAAAVAARLSRWGIPEFVIKDGPRPCLIAWQDRHTGVPAEAVEAAVDTTAAGDAFNAAYLAARHSGAAPQAAARVAHKLAAAVIQGRGAVIPLQAMPAREALGL
ncbi:MAG TPA: sugar kinase [Alphaproteobacteria bacterium]|nr:sugar kinase [Alphaproteobacteria bacterium]